jgi:hypothetical protein
MTAFVRTAIRASGITAADARAAESVLGQRHALTRAVANQHAVAQQSAVATLALVAGAAGITLHLGLAPYVVGAAALVMLGLVLAWAVAHRIARERAQDLIADGADSVVLTVVARERRRLASLEVREAFAHSLETLYRDALRWHAILPQFRPLHGVQQLASLGAEVEGLRTALRRDRIRVQGVALTARLLSDGYRSPLYANEVGPLRDELNRIRYLLESTDTPVADSDAERRAA